MATRAAILVAALFVLQCVHFAAGQNVPIFVGLEVFTPPSIFCVNNDPMQCDVGSSGCNLETFRCILGFFAEANSSIPLVEYSNVGVWGEYYPGAADGKLGFTATFQPGVQVGRKLRGFFQLWREEEDRQNVYHFTGRQRYIDLTQQGDPDSADVLYHDLRAGSFRIVYWDVRGTRLGSGVPEITPEYVLGTVLPRDMGVHAEVMPRTGVAPLYTEIFREDRNWISHHLVGDAGFETWLLNAPDVGRKVMWEHRTDQGNIINVGERTPLVPPSSIVLNNPAAWTDPFFFKHYPLMCGNSCSKRTLIQARLVYIGLPNSEYSEYFADRQRYGYGTVIGRRIMALNRRRFGRGGAFLPSDPVNGAKLTSSGDVDTYDYPAWMRLDGPVQYGLGIETGEAFVMDDFYTSPEWVGQGVVEGQHYRLEPDFVEHENNEANNDYACYPTGTNYARGIGQDPGYRNWFRAVNTCGGPQFADLNSGRRENHMLLDIDWRRDYMRFYFRGTENWNLPTSCNQLCALNTQFDCPCNDLFPSDCANICDPDEEPRNRFEYFGTSARSLRDWMQTTGQFWEREPNSASGCNCFERTANNGRGCVRGFSPGYREDAQIAVQCGMQGSLYPDVNVDNTNISPLLDQVVCYLNAIQQFQGDTGGGAKNWFAHFKQSSGTEIPADQTGFEFHLNDNYWGSVGPDSWVATVKTRVGPNDLEWRDDVGANEQVRIYIDVAAAGYARYKVIPTVEFMQFESFDPGDPDVSGDETINVRFRISCPLLDHEVYPNVNERNTGWCMDVWRVRAGGGAGTKVLEEVIIGDLRRMPAALLETGLDTDDLGEVMDNDLFLIKIKFLEGEQLNIHFFPKLEPEKARWGIGANAQCEDGRYVVPLVEIPPLRYVYQPLACAGRVAAPACEYNTPEILTTCFKGVPYVFSSILNLDLPDVVNLGNVIDQPRHIDYYEYWQFGQEIVQGFAEEFQQLEPGAVVTIYDRLSSVTLTEFPESPLPPTFPNPLARPPRCVSSANATCPVDFDDSDMYSGFDQFHVCTPELTQVTLLEPRLRFVPPFSRVDNVGAVFFNRTTEFVDVFIDEQRYKGIFQMDAGFTVEETDHHTMTVRYGRTIDSLLEAPCFERFIDLVHVLTPFQPDPGGILRDPACVRPDNCCYFIPITVLGNTPVDADIVNLATCFNEYDACKYEVLTSPPPVAPEGTLCLGQEYTYTVQSPEILVQNRSGFGGLPFPEPTPWRCPVTFTITLPVAAFAPIEYLAIPGPCSNPGAVVEFTLRYTSPECAGPISAANSDSSCQLEVAFALRYLTTADDVVGASLGNPYIIQGANSLLYNAGNKFVFPDDFFPDRTDETLQDGQWQVWVWAREVGSGTGFDQVADPRNAVTTTFVTFQEEAEGLRVSRTELFRPQCPQLAGEGDLTDGAIAVDFVIEDLTFRGPYTIQFLSPSGKGLVLDAAGAPCDIQSRTCNITVEFFCGTICPQSDPVCDGCDTKIRVEKIPVRGYIGTGINSIRESGPYRLVARALGSNCNATAVEVVEQMDTLDVDIHCFDSQCAAGNRIRTGIVETRARGGTKIPLFERPLVQGARNEVYKLSYFYSWDTPEGIQNIPFLTNVPTGLYQLNVTDYNNCTAPTASCRVGVISPPMDLVLVNTTTPDCIDAPAELVFRVVNGTPPYTLVKIGPDQQPVDEGGSVILSDQTVIPDSYFVYTVVDAFQCTSPFINFSLDLGIVLSVSISIVAAPCALGENSGRLEANVNVPIKTFLWYLNDNPILDSNNRVLAFAVAGTYRVEVEDFKGCTASASATLTPAGDATIIQIRTDADVDPGNILVTVSGGNGPPFMLDVEPEDGIFTVPLPGTSSVAQYRLEFVPPQWSGFLRFTDAGGCITQAQSVGARIPVDIPFQTPTPLPGLLNFTNVDTGLHPGLAWLIFGYTGAVMLFWALFALLWPRGPPETREEARRKNA